MISRVASGPSQRPGRPFMFKTKFYATDHGRHASRTLNNIPNFIVHCRLLFKRWVKLIAVFLFSPYYP